MKNRIYNLRSILIYGVFCMGAMVLITNCDPDDTQTVANFKTLSWHDEFEVDGAPDPEMWTYDIGIGPNGDGWGNQELQYYTNRPENVVVEDGMLKITAIQENFEGQGYTSGRILTKGKFDQQYGRFEARMKLPFGKGMWAAFWMLGSNIDEVSWPNCGEIDVIESRGSSPTIVSGAVHGPGYCGSSFLCDEEAVDKEYEFESSRVDTEFHVYGVEWGPGYINYYIDDVLYNQITRDSLEDKDVDPAQWVFDNGPFYMLLNLAVGGNFDGNPNADTVFPQTMYVDYVRVYEAD